MSNRTDIVVETDNAEGQVLLSASRVYDLTEDKTQDTINGEIKNTLTQLDGAKAPKSDLASPTNKTTPNNDSNPITKGTYFYLDGDLARAKQFIDANAPFTSGTNYELITVGGLNDFKNKFSPAQVNLTASSKVTLYENSVYKNEFMVAGSLTIDVNTELTAWDTIATGFPANSGNVECLLYKSDLSQFKPAYIQNGVLKSRSMGVPVGSWFLTNISYLIS